jgi:hypothetical protein
MRGVLAAGWIYSSGPRTAGIAALLPKKTHQTGTLPKYRENNRFSSTFGNRITVLRSSFTYVRQANKLAAGVGANQRFGWLWPSDNYALKFLSDSR